MATTVEEVEEVDAELYTVGWIAPMPIELTPARCLLKHSQTVEIDGDDVKYRVGKIGNHHVVMGVCHRIGSSPANTTINHMKRSFPNIKHFLLVGIGGGVPSYGIQQKERNQIVLGDVVVSNPAGVYGGVVDFGFGAWENVNKLTYSGHTLHPSRALLGAVGHLRSDYATEDSKIPKYLEDLRKKLKGDEREQHEDPQHRADRSTIVEDRLFDSDYKHPDEKHVCEGLCDVKRSKVRADRGDLAKREKDSPQIHYGTIGCGGTLVISAEKREELYKDFELLCVEMEGSGVMCDYQALVVRGISDYCDSHKNKRWQKYAAATAAACAKEIVLLLPGSKMKAKSSNIDGSKSNDKIAVFRRRTGERSSHHDDTSNSAYYQSSASAHLISNRSPGYGALSIPDMPYRGSRDDSGHITKESITSSMRLGVAIFIMSIPIVAVSFGIVLLNDETGMRWENRLYMTISVCFVFWMFWLITIWHVPDSLMIVLIMNVIYIVIVLTIGNYLEDFEFCRSKFEDRQAACENMKMFKSWVTASAASSVFHIMWCYLWSFMLE